MLHIGLYDQCVAKTMPRPSYSKRYDVPSQRNVWGTKQKCKTNCYEKLMSTKMVEGTPVREHVLKMISFINELDLLGAEMDAETKVDAILSSLADSFNQFIMNYNMNKMDVTLSELLNMLQAESLNQLLSSSLKARSLRKRDFSLLRKLKVTK